MSATDKRAKLRGGTKAADAIAEDFPQVAEEEPAEPEATPDPHAIEQLPDGTVVIPLTKPFRPHDAKGEDPLANLTEVRVRQLYAGDLLALDDAHGSMAQIRALAKQLSGLPWVALDRMHGDDYARVHGVVQGRLGKFLGTSRPLWALS